MQEENTETKDALKKAQNKVCYLHYSVLLYSVMGLTIVLILLRLTTIRHQVLDDCSKV